jgi:hypothetical protein
LSLQLEPETFRLSHSFDAASVVQLANQALADRIAEAAIGPTRASRAFALLNSAFFDLWAVQDLNAIPLYGGAVATAGFADQLEPALLTAAQQLLQQWFPDAEPWEVELLDPPLAPMWLDAISGVLHQLPVLDPWAGVPSTDTAAAERVIDVWTPEHVPIDDITAPLETFLTPEWGSLPAFATDDVSVWRPDGPEPFLLVDDSVAVVELSSAQLTLTSPWVDGSGSSHPAGVYDITDARTQDWLLQGMLNPAFIDQAKQLVDIQAELSDEQKLIAEFWEDGASTSFPPGSWMAITSLVAEQEALELSEQIHLFFAVGQALGDAGIAAWDSKAYFDYARPVRVIRDLDALNLLDGDHLQQWNSYQPPGSNSSPPFPEYVSGHSSFSAAAAEVLQRYLGHDQLDLSVDIAVGGSRFEPGITPAEPITLAWESFSAAAQSAGDSRLYGGIHFADGNEDGLALGQAVGRDVWSAAQDLAYGALDDELLQPFGLANDLTLHGSAGWDLDGYVLTQDLRRLQLGRGSDTISLTPDLAVQLSIDAGSGMDALAYSNDSEAVVVDLSLGQASGLVELWGVEQVSGTSAPDRLTGDGASNWLQGNGGDDWLDGGDGFDTARYRGNRSDYVFASNRIVDQRSPESVGFDGTDELRGIEQLSFADGSWPVELLFPARSSALTLSPADAFSATLQEGDVLSLELQRQGDLSEALVVDLGWQPRLEHQLSWADTHAMTTNALYRVEMQAGVNRLPVSLETRRDGYGEGVESGFLQIAHAAEQADFDALIPLQLEWSADPVRIELSDAEAPVTPVGTQLVASSPLPLWVKPGSELRVPLSYSVSDQADALSGVAVVLEPLPDGFTILGFDPHPQAVERADLWGLDPLDDGSLQLSFLSFESGWPGVDAQMPLLLGELRFAVDASWTAPASQHDPVTGLSMRGHHGAMGYDIAVQQPLLQSLQGWSLDVDGDGQVLPFSDALLVIRHLLGLRGDALTSKALSPQAERSGVEVEDWISAGVDQGFLDLDGDGQVTPFSDGLLLLRSALGMSGDRLLAKAVSPQSPLLAGHPLEGLDLADRQWVADQLIARVESLY